MGYSLTVIGVFINIPFPFLWLKQIKKLINETHTAIINAWVIVVVTLHNHQQYPDR